MPFSIEDINTAAQKAANDLGLSPQEAPPKEGEPEPEPELGEEEPGEEESIEAEPEEVEPGKSEKPPSKFIPKRRFDEVYGESKQKDRVIEYLTGLLKQTQQTPAPEKEVPETLPDFEEMTNKELALWMVNKLGDKIDKTISSKVSPVLEQSELERATRDIDQTARKYQDYFDYRDEMINIAKRHPSLNAEEVYRLAKGDKEAVAKSVTQRMKQKVQQKKNAKVEKHSSPAAKMDTKKEYKTVREAALAVAEKLGMK